MATIPSGGGAGSGGSGWVKIADVSVPGGSTTSKVFQDANNTVLQSATVSAVDVLVTLKASYPIVDVNGSLKTLPPAADDGHYEDDVAVTIAGTGPLTATVQTANNLAGAVDACDLTLDPPPALLTLAFSGSYPGSQTELKEDDLFTVTGTTDKAIDLVEVLDYEACKLQQFAASGTTFSVSATIDDEGNTLVARPARVRVRDAVTGAWSDTRDTNFGGGTTDGVHLVDCNNLAPTVNIGVITYPGGQGALKASEGASVAVATANYDTIVPFSPVAELNITGAPPTYTATRIAGSYNDSTPNFRLTATRNANGAQTVAEVVVEIAAVAPTSVTVAEPAARLRSGGNDGTSAQDYEITVTSDQKLATLALDADTGGSRGTLLASWAGGPKVWTRDLQVHDDDEKGIFDWMNLVATNLAGLATNTISGNSQYVLGGFVQRNLTFAAYSQTTTLNVAVEDYTKVSAGIFTATNQPAVRHTPQGDHADAANEYTIDSPLSTKPQTLWWNDVAAAGAHSTGTAQITDVEEAV